METDLERLLRRFRMAQEAAAGATFGRRKVGPISLGPSGEVLGTPEGTDTIAGGLPAAPGAYQGGLAREQYRRSHLQRMKPREQRIAEYQAREAARQGRIAGSIIGTFEPRPRRRQEFAAPGGQVDQEPVDFAPLAQGGRRAQVPGGDGHVEALFGQLSAEEQSDLIDIAHEDPVFAPQIDEALQQIAATSRVLDQEDLTGQEREVLAEHVANQRKRLARVTGQFAAQGVGGAEALARLRVKRRRGEAYTDPSTGALITLDQHGVPKVLVEGPDLEKITDMAVKSVREQHAAEYEARFKASKPGEAVEPAAPVTQDEIDAEVRARIKALQAAREALQEINQPKEEKQPSPRPAPQPPPAETRTPEDFRDFIMENYPQLAGDMPQTDVRGPAPGDIRNARKTLQAEGIQATDEEVADFLQEIMAGTP